MSTFKLSEFVTTVDRIRRTAIEDHRLTNNPSDEDLRHLVEQEVGIRSTVYENYVTISEPSSRAAMFTKNSVDHPFGDAERHLLSQCEYALAQEPLISIDCVVGHKKSDTIVRLLVPVRFAHVAYGGKNLFLPVKNTLIEPTYHIVFFIDEAFDANKSKPLQQKDITIRLAMLDDGQCVKIIRNSNYIGEYKKGVFAFEDWTAKTKKGGIFLHAGCREDYLQTWDGSYRNVRTLLLALSANGKTTTTSMILARKGKEKSWLIQDDGGTLLPDGSFHGFEGGGIYVKTECVDPGRQREIFYGLLKPHTLLENVYVTEDGYFDFYNLTQTSNGRAVIPRRDFLHTSPYVDVDAIDNIILITRGPLVPAISQLTREQAVALMILGQAEESSAGNPTQAGRIRSEFFYDPFVAGDKADHANRFYAILRGLSHIRYFLLNTGGIGEGSRYLDITLEHTRGILDSLMRGGLDQWIASPTGVMVPKAIRLVDDIYLHPEKLYSTAEFKEKQNQLKQFRNNALKRIGKKLHPTIRNAFL